MGGRHRRSAVDGREARNLGDQHFRPCAENVGKLALAPGIEMHDNNESGLDVVRQAFEKHLQGVTPPADVPTPGNGFRPPSGSLLPRLRKDGPHDHYCSLWSEK